MKKIIISLLLVLVVCFFPLYSVFGQGGEGAVCTGYDIKIDVPGTHHIGVIIVADAYAAAWEANTGYEITGACVKIGGPSGGSLITFGGGSGSYLYDKYEISHVAVSFRPIPTSTLESTPTNTVEPTPTNTYVPEITPTVEITPTRGITTPEPTSMPMLALQTGPAGGPALLSVLAISFIGLSGIFLRKYFKN